MHVTLVHVRVNPEHIQDFIAATRANHQASVQEPGNLRFDVLQSPEDPGYFLLYEAYRSPRDAAAHKETAHYLKWTSTRRRPPHRAGRTGPRWLGAGTSRPSCEGRPHR